jgi:D-alanyl-D-alanine carboxypeptidase
MHRELILTGMCLLMAGCASLRPYHPPARLKEPPGLEVDRETAGKCQAVLDDAVNTHRLVGLQVSIRFPDGRTWNGAAGSADLSRNHPLLPSSIIRMGSLTKTYTAAVVLRLAERGVISLDDTLGRWFPEYAKGKRIRVRMLLNHSSGIFDLLGPRVMMLSSVRGGRVWRPDELLHMIFGRDLMFQPGSDHRYSNSNYVLLGLIAEKAAGKPLNELYADEIFKPLMLHQTVFLPSDPAPSGLVDGFDRDLIPLPGWHVTRPENTAWSSCAHASGAMAATASDVLRFFTALMDGKIVGAESLGLMTSFERAAKPEDRYLAEFGSGLFRYGDFYDGCYGHLGLFVGSEAVALFHPQKRYTVALLANVSRIRDRDGLVKKFLDLARDDAGRN